MPEGTVNVYYEASAVIIAAGVFYASAGLLLSLIFAAAAMSLSRVFVLTNALRLRRFTAPVSALQGTGVGAGTASSRIAQA